MTWTHTPPTEPGRYWWRAPDKYGRHESRQYGLLLVQWTAYGEWEPSLRVVCLSIFNATYGGELGVGGSWAYGSGHTPREMDNWAYGSGHTPREMDKSYPGIEFWSVPERGPEGFLPELAPKPDWTPPDPVVVQAARKKAAEASAKAEKTEAAKRAKRLADAKEAGATLFTCEGCDELLDEDALIQVRECPHCGEAKFNGTESGQNCPQCNRRFTRNITEQGCPDCLEECEPLVDTAAAPTSATPKKKAKR